MLLNAKIIGVGAAGNKAVIKLHEKYPDIAKDITLVNSTLKDIPAEYRELALQLDGEFRGCAKERGVASDMMLETIKSGNFDYIGDPTESMTIIVTSSEGGTGSGASIMLANYIHQIYKSHIHFFIFTGFEDDVRGLKNTVDLFKELSDEYTVQSISNKSFLEESSGNRIKAEQLANEKFADNINILLGGTINESIQNIDESDLMKLDHTPGFMIIDHVDMSRIKNTKDFNTRLTEALDGAKSLNVEPTCKRMATIIDVKEQNLDFVDYSFDILKKRFGMPFESFRHIQSVHTPEYLDIIIGGLKMPIEDIEDTYNIFKEQQEAVDVSKDEFFNTNYETDAGLFDTLGKKNSSADEIEKAKAAFFASNKSAKPDTKIKKAVEPIDVKQNW